MGKCKGFVDEITINFGLKSRPRAGLATDNDASSPPKKIKKTTPYDNFVKEVDSTTAMAAAVTAEVDGEIVNCSTITTATTTTSSSDFVASCCSSNENDDRLRKNDVVKDRRIADPEVESGETSSRYNDCITTSEEKEAKEEGIKSNGEDQSNGKSTVRIKRMPSDSEIEEFFVAAERDIHQRFIDKYNFDIVKDVPLEGRYEWVQIKP